MQDNTPSYRAKKTTAKLQERGVRIVEQPAYLPDLNPIETVWDQMKDQIDDRYKGMKLTYLQLRSVVIAAQYAVPKDFLNQLLNKIPAHCQAVIDAKGKITKY